MLSNIAAGNKSQVEALCKESTTVQTLVGMASGETCRRTKFEAIHFVSNLCTSKWVNLNEMDIVVGFKGMNALLMATKEPTVASTALEALGTLLKLDGKILSQADFVVAGGVSKLKKLQTAFDGIKQGVEHLLALVEDQVPVDVQGHAEPSSSPIASRVGARRRTDNA